MLEFHVLIGTILLLPFWLELQTPWVCSMQQALIGGNLRPMALLLLASFVVCSSVRYDVSQEGWNMQGEDALLSFVNESTLREWLANP